MIPSYNEQDNIFRTYETIEEILKQSGIDFEIIFVDDGSMDNTYVNIVRLAQTKANVKGLSFPVILAKKRRFSQDLKLLPENVPSLWTAIYSILLHFFRKCTNYGRTDMRW